MLLKSFVYPSLDLAGHPFVTVTALQCVHLSRNPKPLYKGFGKGTTWYWGSTSQTLEWIICGRYVAKKHCILHLSKPKEHLVISSKTRRFHIWLENFTLFKLGTVEVYYLVVHFYTIHDWNILNTTCNFWYFILVINFMHFFLTYMLLNYTSFCQWVPRCIGSLLNCRRLPYRKISNVWLLK